MWGDGNRAEGVAEANKREELDFQVSEGRGGGPAGSKGEEGFVVGVDVEGEEGWEEEG